MDRSRGQVILIAALGIAVTLVALALVTNTAIYTENLATRETVSGQEAIAFEQSMEEGTSGLLALANRYNASDHDTIRDRFESDVSNLSAGATIESAGYGDLRSVSLVTTTKGSRIYQNGTGNFTNATGNETWTLATDVNQTRRFEMNVSRSSLDSTSPFRVVVDNGTAEWTANFSDEEGGDITVALSNGSEPVTCSVEAKTAIVDLTEGTLAGEPCEGPTFASNVDGPYDIRFENASNVEGRFVLFVDRVPDDIDGGYDENATNPSLAPAIYNATVHVTVRQPDVTYETNVTVAPERSPEGEVYGIVP